MRRVARVSVSSAAAMFVAVGMMWSPPAWSQSVFRNGSTDDGNNGRVRGQDDEDGDHHGSGGGNGGGRNRCLGSCLGQFRDCLAGAQGTHRACVRSCLALRGQIAQACSFSGSSLDACSQAIQAFQGCLSSCAANFSTAQRECVDIARTCLGGCNAPPTPEATATSTSAPAATATATPMEAETPTFTPTPAAEDTATSTPEAATETPTATPTVAGNLADL